ncbi:MAG: hypothetical protein AB8H80_22925, partial [Planctomycetota bacterium]
MTDKEAKDPGDGQQPQKKPRGMGGVILILALLMALFLVVSSSSRDGQSSVQAFYSYLLNGHLSKVTWSDGVASAQVMTPSGERPIEVVLREFLRYSDMDIDLVSTLAVTKLDKELYPSGSAPTRRFFDDVNEDRVRVLQAFLTNEVESKVTNGQVRKEDPLRKPGAYVTALLQRGSAVHYVRLDAPTDSSGAPSLQEISTKLAEKDVPMQSRTLSLGGGDFRVTEPNTALIYILGTVGPWLLVLAIVWFFILRQMRSPGGSGGFFFNDPTTTEIYTKENRTNITFDDVAGMEEAKAEVREIIEFLK